MPGKTARQEIMDVLKAQGWNFDEFAQGTVYGRWRRRTVLVEFTKDGRIISAHTKRPADFNYATIVQTVTQDRRAQILAFIRGERV